MRWDSIFAQTWASLFYYQNWFLAAESVDYYAAQHSVASPLQHFWSLSIQGQIFILWPLVFALATVLTKLTRLRIRRVLVVLFGTIFIASLVFSIVTTANNQAFAYFDTRARLWEFALGTLLALTLPRLNLARGLRICLGWLGVISMVSCGIVLQVGQQFPGYMALWPTLAAAAIIAAGFTNSRIGADRFLSWKPLVKLGDSSYALYLFHWLVLIVYLVVSGNEKAGLLPGLVIILVSIVAASMATKYIDAPLRRNKWLEQKRRRAVAVIIACMVVVAVPLSGWQAQIRAENEAALSQADRNNPGAAAMIPGFVNKAKPEAPLLPTESAMPNEWPSFEGGSCVSDGQEMINICDNGITDGSKTVVVWGNSHAHTFNTPVLTMAKKNHWSVKSFTKGFCPLSAGPTEGVTESCIQFNQETLDQVLAMKPDVVVTTSTRTNAATDVPEDLEASWIAGVETLQDAGIEVVALRDTPRTIRDVPECLAETPTDFIGCGAKREDIFSATPPTASIKQDLSSVKFLDFTNYFCDATYCPAVIGNVIVYKDDNHVTRTFMDSLTPIFEKEFITAAGWTNN